GAAFADSRKVPGYDKVEWYSLDYVKELAGVSNRFAGSRADLTARLELAMIAHVVEGDSEKSNRIDVEIVDAAPTSWQAALANRDLLFSESSQYDVPSAVRVREAAAMAARVESSLPKDMVHWHERLWANSRVAELGAGIYFTVAV